MDISIQKIILAIITIYIIYNILKNKNTIQKVSCTISDDNPSCKMYNNRDINTKCSVMCLLNNIDSIYNGKHTLKDKIHTCECIVPNTEKFISLQKFDTPILGKHIKNDSLFSDRNYVEKQQYNRFNSLIFG